MTFKRCLLAQKKKKNESIPIYKRKTKITKFVTCENLMNHAKKENDKQRIKYVAM